MTMSIFWSWSISKGRRWPPAWAKARSRSTRHWRYTKEIAGALDYAHRQGIVHRDLKPANIMLTAGGAKLLDFGLAKFQTAANQAAVDADATRVSPTAPSPAAPQVESGEIQHAHLTRDGAILGTVRYMAPEQLMGRDADARSDLFSFGAVLYEMFTGRRAFEAGTIGDIRAAILQRDSPPVSPIQPLAPESIDEIVRRCLSKDPTARWQTAGEVLHELKVRLRREQPAAAPDHPDSVDRSPAAGGSLGRRRRRLLRRRYDGTTHCRSRDHQETACHVSHLRDALQNCSQACAGHCTGTARRRDHRRFGDACRRQGADHGQVDRRGLGEVVWAQTFERDLRDVLALQREMARVISSKVNITLTPQEQERLTVAPVVDPEVHRQVLLGRHHTAKATEEALRKAVQYFEVALAKAPENAMAHAGLAEAYMGLSGYYMPPRVAMPKAKQAAETAIRFDQSLADAHAVLGYIHLVVRLGRACGQGIAATSAALNPALATARLHYAAYLTTQAQHDEAAMEIRRTIEFDPRLDTEQRTRHQLVAVHTSI